MYDNIGENLKVLAMVLFVLGIIGGLGGGIAAFFIFRNLWLPLLVAVGTSILAWIASMLSYAFGELVENSTIIVDQLASIKKSSAVESSKNESEKKGPFYAVPQNDSVEHTCPHCKEKVYVEKSYYATHSVLTCPHCNQNFDKFRS